MKKYRQVYKPFIDINEYALRFVRGGTEAAYAPLAVEKLGLVDSTSVDVEEGLFSLNAQGKLDDDVFPNRVVVDEIKITTTDEVFYATVAYQFKIDNFDSFTSYTQSATNGTITRNHDVLTYTPATAGAGGFTINGKAINLTIVAATAKPKTPKITYPLHGQTGVFQRVDIESTAYSNISGSATHASSHWQVAADADFTSLALEDIDNPTLKTSYICFDLVLGAVYFARVRYKDSAGTYSDWSEPVAFKIASNALFTFGGDAQSLVPSDPQAGILYGIQLAITPDRSRVAVGSLYAGQGAPGEYKGAVYVYRREIGGNYVQEAKLVPDGFTGGNVRLGEDVKLSADGSRLFVGCRAGEYLVTHTGYVGGIIEYRRTGTAWAQFTVHQPSIQVDPGVFGFRISLSPNETVLAAIDEYGYAYQGQPSSETIGRVFIYRKNVNGDFIYEASWLNADETLTQTDTFTSELVFGPNNDKLYVGNHNAQISPYLGAGKIYELIKVGNNWVTNQEIMSPNNQTNSYFGNSIQVSSDGNRLYATHQAGKLGKQTVEIYELVNSLWKYKESIVTELKAVAQQYYNGVLRVNSDETRLAINGIRLDYFFIQIFKKVDNKWVQDSIISRLSNTSSTTARSYLGSAFAIPADWSEIYAGDLTAVISGNSVGRVYRYNLS